nr:hypothetical protein Iba_chr03eCG4150 [Ipomoea batatas]GMD04676.1 hypothetical protein Iba_chr06aCG20590 [Ipomoea batatas]
MFLQKLRRLKATWKALSNSRNPDFWTCSTGNMPIHLLLELGLWFWYNLEVQMGSLLILAQFLKQLVFQVALHLQ